jgi:hypothetical protein
LWAAVILVCGTLLLLDRLPARADGGADGPLTVEIGSAYNLVVDSNVESPSTYAPSVATVLGRLCNTGATKLTDVWAYIGDYTNGTPGLYPARTVDADFTSTHPALNNPGSYAFSHVGGRAGRSDASRYIGELAPGECKVQYWHFTYPQCENDGYGAPDTPPCDDSPVWGDSVKPEDDLWLDFDVWATAAGGYDSGTTRRMTMRNEISATANKIEPNGSPGGQWFNDTAPVRVGSVITTVGIRYNFGNVNQGSDNDGDFVPDYNAWAQPIGDPGYDRVASD